MRWQLVSRESLIWRELDGEIVLRNDRTGSTHLFGALAAEVLRTLLEAPDALDATELAPSIEALLSDFQRLGLAEPSP